MRHIKNIISDINLCYVRYEKEVANNCKDFYQFGLSLYISMVYHKFSTDNVGTVKDKKGRRTDLLVQ